MPKMGMAFEPNCSDLPVCGIDSISDPSWVSALLICPGLATPAEPALGTSLYLTGAGGLILG